MGSVAIKTPSQTAVPKGTGVPSRVTSPNLIRAANIAQYGQQLAKDLEFLSQNINDLHGLLTTNVPSLAHATATATPSTPGGIILAGDLGGTAKAPLVVGLQGVKVSAIPPSSGQVLSYVASSHDWESVSSLNISDITVTTVTAQSLTVTGATAVHTLTADSLNTTALTTANATFSNAAQITFGSNWQNWTPTSTPLAPMTVTGTPTIEHAYYIRMGPTVFFSLTVSVVFATTASGQVDFSLPVNANDALYHPVAGSLSQAGFVLGASHIASNVCRFNLPAGANFTLGVTYTFRASGFYRVA